MSNLLKLIKANESLGYTELFKNVLHKSPFHLKYSLDKNRPNLLMIYTTPLSTLTDPIVRECNGIILNKNDYSVVAYGLNNLIELSNIQQVYQICEKQEDQKDHLSVIESQDGSILKVFYYKDNNEWIVSTNKRIDASRVKWSSNKTFYELLNLHLEKHLDENMTINDLFEKTLNKEYTYSFVLTGPENYHIIPYDTYNLMYISKRNNITMEEDLNCDLNVDWITIPKQVDVSNIENVLESKNQRGLIIQKDNIRYKYDYIWFNFAEKLRYNMPSLTLSYLACDYNERIEFRKVFGTNPLYDHIDEMIKNIINYTFQVYRESYIRKQYKVPSEHPILMLTSKIHHLYKSKNVPITIHDVYIILNTIPAYTLDSIILFFNMYGFVSLRKQIV